MASKSTTVTLYRPDGGTVREYDYVEVTHYDKNIVEFQRRTESGAEATVTSFTSNLPYVISETVVGPKNLI